MTTLSRRAFIVDAALLTAGLHPLSTLAFGPAPVVLRVGILDGADSRIDGALLGIDEARHAAMLFGGDVSLTRVQRDATLAGINAIITNGDRASLQRILSASRAGSALDAPLIFNVALGDDDLRGAGCDRRLFHVIPSDAMRRDAGDGKSDGVVAWDPSLERFGADTLNQRFHARTSRAMDEPAWCAWFAVKVLWESALRAKTSAPAKLAEYLRRETTQFDGHKGRPLSFRSWDQQLRQPVYVPRAGQLVEAPPAAGDAPAREALDHIGTPQSASSCRIGA